MDEKLFNTILQIGTFNGEACYNNYEELEKDYKALDSVSLNPEEIRRLIFTAYKMGEANGNDRRRT